MGYYDFAYKSFNFDFTKSAIQHNAKQFGVAKYFFPNKQSQGNTYFSHFNANFIQEKDSTKH